MIQNALREKGQNVWMDETNLDKATPQLQATVEKAMLQTRIIILCLGRHDLERCVTQDDFLRWEIDTARKLENENRVKVAILIHGVTKWEDIFGREVQRTNWGKNLKSYFQRHYVTIVNMKEYRSLITDLLFLTDPRKKAWYLLQFVVYMTNIQILFVENFLQARCESQIFVMKVKESKGSQWFHPAIQLPGAMNEQIPSPSTKH